MYTFCVTSALVPAPQHSKTGAMTMSLTDTEFRSLRADHRSRGTVRMALLPVTLLGWALVAVLLLLFGDLPVGRDLSPGDPGWRL